MKELTAAVSDVVRRSALTLAVLGLGCAHVPKAPEGFYLLADVDTQPVLKLCHAYERPEQPGHWFIVRFGVIEDGRVVNPRVQVQRNHIRSGPSEELSVLMISAAQAISSCEFYPATRGGREVAVHDMGMMIWLPPTAQPPGRSR